MAEFHSEDLTLFGGLGRAGCDWNGCSFVLHRRILRCLVWLFWFLCLVLGLLDCSSRRKSSLLQHRSLCLCPFVGWEYEIATCQKILKEWNEENSLSISACLFLEFFKCVSLSTGLLHLLPPACSVVGLIITVGWELRSLAHRQQGKPSGVLGLAQGSAACGCGRRLDKPPCLLQCC